MNTNKLLKFLNRALYLGSAALLVTAMFLTVAVQPAQAANAGAIWTTTGSCGTPQNSNHYKVYDTVYINFSNMPAGSTSWQIQQADGTPPKPIVASGSFLVDSSGAGCFAAHVIQPSESNHEYQVTFGNKGDNYQVDEYVAPTSTPTKTATSTSVPPTNTPTFTATVTNTPTDTPTNTVTNTPTDTPTSTEVPPTATSTNTPTNTEVPPTETPIPPTQGTPNEPTSTSVEPTNTPEEPTSTPETQEPTKRVPPSVKEPPSLGVDPVCTVDGKMQWTVLNPNGSNFPVDHYTVDGVVKGGFSALPGKHNLTTTSDGTHTVVLFYGESQTVSLTYTIAVCQLPQPQSGNNVLIPVTGADNTASMANAMFFGSSTLAGLGLLLSALRRLLK